MSKHAIRKDKTCLNCNYVVENRFCSNCGQENSDTRKSFYELFVHFFEDLTHYENSFWRTIKNLLLKPASLTKEYLSGKRMSYLAPIRLYIFISFVTFFLLSVIPEHEKSVEVSLNEGKNLNKKDSIYKEQEKIIEFEKKGLLTKKQSDSLQKFIREGKKKQDKHGTLRFGNRTYKNVKELDSIQKFAKTEDKLHPIRFWLDRKDK